MNKLNDARRKLRSELEAPPALRKFGIGGHPVPLGYVKHFKYPFQRKKA